ncbi:MAG: mannose-6-phosphate isomerase, class I [Marmoricola sp.]
MRRLHNGVQRYEWGSPDAIPQFLGVTPEGGPVAEMWIGTHPLNPSMVIAQPGGSTDESLSDAVGDLPFMLKLLAAERPLSLQVHPSLAQAQSGFEMEEAAGVPIDAPERVYKDANHKPEMVYALTTFDSLIGFRPTAEILRVLSPLDAPLARQLAADLRADPGFAGIVRRLQYLLTSHVTTDEIAAVVKACQVLADHGLDVKRAYVTAVELAEAFPNDVGVVISLLLNRMTLQPGEAAFLETGVIHAHLRGMCLEVMASSDNVLRAGLTNKHIDPQGLVACLDQGMARVARVTPDYQLGDAEVFAPADVEFALSVVQVSPADNDGVEVVKAGPTLLICTGGEVTVRTAAQQEVLRRGESLVLNATDDSVTVHGLGEVVTAFEPRERAMRSRMVDVLPRYGERRQP